MPNFKKEPPPRKASVDKDSPLFSPYAKHIGLKFNGRVLLREGVVEYDADEGYVIWIKRDELGRPMSEKRGDGQRHLMFEKVEGTVEVYWK